MRCLLLILLLLIPTFAEAATGSAAVDLFYARAATVCPNNGDGLAYGCAASPGASGAFSGLSNIVWTATTGVDDGDTLYVCGVIPGPLAVSATATGTTGSHITISFACPGDAGTVRTITNMTEALTALNWTNESTNVWYLDVSAYTWKDPKRVWIDSTEVFPASAKAALNTTEGPGAPTARFYYDSGTSRLHLYSTANPATTFSLFESLVAGAGTCAYSAICFNANANKFFDVIDPTLTGGNQATVYVLGAENITFTGSATNDSACHIGGYGVWGMKITDTSVGGTGTASANIMVRDCTVDPLHPVTFTNMNWQTWGSSDGIALVNGTSWDLITSNTIQNWGHVNVNISATLGTLTTTDNVVSNNTLTCDSFTEYCRGMAINGATAGRATRNLFTGNIIDGQAVHSELNGDGNIVSSNMWRNARLCTISVVYDCTQIGQFLDMEGFTGVVSLNNAILNNTFENNTYAPCVTFRVGLNTKSGYLVQSNRFINCGGTSMTNYEYTALTLENGASVGNQMVRDNIFYTNGQANKVFYKASGKINVAGFQAACSGDTCTGNIALTGDVAANRLPAGTRTTRGSSGFIVQEISNKIVLEDGTGSLLKE